ncbi:MAG: tetratricopeptide repeat protein [Alphaproteobacteria bacterium]|nr:tetratricopeptide repeat protein [Alphaproteobacteria bacterium]
MTAETAPHHADFIPAPLRRILPYAALALAVFAVYGNIWDNGYLFDDDLLITINSFIRSWSHFGDIWAGSTTGGAHIAGGFYRPMQITLYLLMYQLGGGSTVPFHALNLSLHIANACLVYRLGTKIGFKPWGVFLAALVWAVHPLHTEAVTYMSATADPLFTLFCLLGIIFLLPDFTWRKILAVTPIFILGLLSKETTAMFPLLVAVCMFSLSPDRTRWRLYARTIPLWAITLAYSFWRIHAHGFDGPQTYARLYALPQFATLKMYADHPVDRIYTFFATLPAYLELLIWPHGLHMERAFAIFTAWWQGPVLIGMTLFAAALAIIIYSNAAPDRNKALSWGLLWFGAAHAPDTGLLVQMNSLFLEHWMYLPSAGLFLGIGETAARALENKPRRYGIAASASALAFALILSAKTYAQNRIWHDPVSFYTNIFDHGEKSARSHNNLALYYGNLGDYADSLAQFEQAVAISDTYAETRYNMALIYLNMPGDADADRQQAIDNLNRAVHIDPSFFRAWEVLSRIYAVQGDKEKAAFCAQKAAAITAQQPPL